MVRPPTELGSLRLSRLEKERLLMALLCSLLIHLCVWGGYEAGKKIGLWQKWHLFRQHPVLAQVKKPVDTAQPTVFVDVSDASPEAPKEAKYYSDKNSRAANPESDKDSNVPKLTGTQKEVPKTENVPRPVKAPPTPPEPAQPEKQTQPEKTESAKALAAGDSEKIHKADTLKPGPEPQKPERPRTLQQARAMQPNQIAGMQMQQDGGVQRHNNKVSLDAIATPFGAYDAAIIAAVQQRWDDLLAEQHYAYNRIGKVTVTFRLHPDGVVTETKIIRNTVGDIWGYICVSAIEESAPFGKWPSDMRRMIGGNYRDVTFTFIYSPD